MKKIIFGLFIAIIASNAFAAVTVSEFALRTEGEIINGKPFLTTSNGIDRGQLGDQYIVGSGTCSVKGLTVGFHKTGNCDQNFAMVTCNGGKFSSIIKVDKVLLEQYLGGEVSISEYPTGFWAPNKCATAASIKVK